MPHLYQINLIVVSNLAYYEKDELRQACACSFLKLEAKFTKKILLTGASAYIENKSNEQNITWKSSDLFDLNEITEVMKNVDIAIYLVHSIIPSAKLTQASFKDMDEILADNFAKASRF